MNVTPGYTFGSGEAVTLAKLNLLGTPVVALADGEVTDAKSERGIVARSGYAYVVPAVTNTPSTNGANLLAAYAAAKALTPHGAALSATNRAAVLLLPGVYDVGTGALTLDTQHVDVIGVVDGQHGARYGANVVIRGSGNGASTGVVKQTAYNVVLANVVVRIEPTAGSVSNATTDPAAYWPNDNIGGTVRNCTFETSDPTKAYAMRQGIEYSGVYERVYCEDYNAAAYGAGGFGGSTGELSGICRDCTMYNPPALTGEFYRCLFQGVAMGDATGDFWSCRFFCKSNDSSGDEVSGQFYDCVYKAGTSLGQFTGLWQGGRIEVTSASQDAVVAYTGARVYGAVVVATGTNTFAHPSTPTVAVAGCLLNKAIAGGVTNSIGTPYNVVDADVL